MIKCNICNGEVETEFGGEGIHIGDGDFVCNKTCEDKFITNRNEFFDNIGNDDWYRENYPELNMDE